MELGISINNRRKQSVSIDIENLCNFLYGVQYQFPYPVRIGQLESIASGFAGKSVCSLMCLKPHHRAKCVVLHHSQRKASKTVQRSVHLDTFHSRVVAGNRDKPPR